MKLKPSGISKHWSSPNQTAALPCELNSERRSSQHQKVVEDSSPKRRGSENWMHKMYRRLGTVWRITNVADVTCLQRISQLIFWHELGPSLRYCRNWMAIAVLTRSKLKLWVRSPHNFQPSHICHSNPYPFHGFLEWGIPQTIGSTLVASCGPLGASAHASRPRPGPPWHHERMLLHLRNHSAQPVNLPTKHGYWEYIWIWLMDQ